MTQAVQILGSGKHLPARLVTSTEIEKVLAMREGTIMRKYGVETRYWAEPSATNAQLGAAALSKALDDALMTYEDIDLLIYASATYDYPLPSTACFIKRELGVSHINTPVLDVSNSCLSFVSALQVASSLISVGQYRHVAIVTSEIASRSISPTRPETYSMFGDMAVAYILGPSQGDSVVGRFSFETYADGALYTIVRGGGNVLPGQHLKEESQRSSFFFDMDGSHVLRFSITKIQSFLDRYRHKTGRSLGDYDHIITHQASKLGLDFFTKNYDLTEVEVHRSLHLYGNTVAAALPVTLHDAIQCGSIKRGQEILLLGTSAGISIGAAMIRY